MDKPRVSVGVVVLNRKGGVLGLKSYKCKGNYTLIAGHVEYGETLCDAVRREVREESGLEVENITPLRVVERIQTDTGDYHKTGHWLGHIHLCEAVSEDVVLNDEAESYEWFNPSELLARDDVDVLTRQGIESFVREHGSQSVVDIKPGTYRHSRSGKMYEVIGVGRNSESLGAMVVYKALYDHPEFGKGALWVRPAGMFVEQIELGGNKVPRFARVE